MNSWVAVACHRGLFARPTSASVLSSTLNFSRRFRRWTWDQAPGSKPRFASPLMGPFRDAIPPPRMGLDVPKFLMFCGPGCDEYASQIKDWPALFTMSESDFKALGYKHPQTWNILRTVDRYREGFLPTHPWIMSPKFKRKEIVKERLAATRPERGKGARKPAAKPGGKDAKPTPKKK